MGQTESAHGELAGYRFQGGIRHSFSKAPQAANSAEVAYAAAVEIIDMTIQQCLRLESFELVNAGTAGIAFPDLDITPSRLTETRIHHLLLEQAEVRRKLTGVSGIFSATAFINSQTTRDPLNPLNPLETRALDDSCVLRDGDIVSLNVGVQAGPCRVMATKMAYISGGVALYGPPENWRGASEIERAATAIEECATIAQAALRSEMTVDALSGELEKTVGAYGLRNVAVSWGMGISRGSHDCVPLQRGRHIDCRTLENVNVLPRLTRTGRAAICQSHLIQASGRINAGRVM